MLLHDHLRTAARWAPDAPALADLRPGVTPRRWTFSELFEGVTAMAAHIADRTAPGDVVAIDTGARAEVILALYAIPASGRRALLVNQRLGPAERDDLMERTRPALVLDGASFDSPAVDPHPAALNHPASADDTAWLIDTSGTTGTPKTVMLTHRSLLAGATNTLLARPVEPDDTYLFPFPLYHVATYNVIVHHLARRPVVLAGAFDAERIAEVIRSENVTSMSLAPTMLAMLLDQRGVGDLGIAGGGTLRRIGYGASGIDPALLSTAIDRLGCEFAQGYGMTELSGNATFLTAEDHRRGHLRDAGRPGPLTDIRLGDGDEILVAGPQLCAGYLSAPGATNALLRPDPDGTTWLHTGDVGMIHTVDGTPMLRVVDRLKDIIVTGGENVASREVEIAITAHPAVAAAAVIATPHERWGEQVTAVIVPTDPGAPPSRDELANHCRSQLAGYKVPKRWIVAGALPANASGKVLKAQLRRQFG